MKTEREAFDLWFKKNFHDLHEAICCGDLVAKRSGKCRAAHKRERRYRRIRNFRPHNIRYAGKMRVINFYN